MWGTYLFIYLFIFIFIETNSVVITDLPLAFYITKQLEHYDKSFGFTIWETNLLVLYYIFRGRYRISERGVVRVTGDY